MNRTLSLAVAALAAVALSGCVTSGYGYRGGSGDYYYGRSTTSHYGHGAPYGSVGYGYPGGWYGSLGYGSRYYRGPYRYGYGPYYPPYRRPVVVRPPHPHKPRPPRVERPDHPDRPGRTGIPWRDLDELRGPKPGVPMSTPSRPEVAQSPRPRGSVRVAPAVAPQPRMDTRPEPGVRGVRAEGRGRAMGGSRIQEETP
jgi:hypothetical protein